MGDLFTVFHALKLYQHALFKETPSVNLHLKTTIIHNIQRMHSQCVFFDSGPDIRFIAFNGRIERNAIAERIFEGVPTPKPLL